MTYAWQSTQVINDIFSQMSRRLYKTGWAMMSGKNSPTTIWRFFRRQYSQQCNIYFLSFRLWLDDDKYTHDIYNKCARHTKRWCLAWVHRRQFWGLFHRQYIQRYTITFNLFDYDWIRYYQLFAMLDESYIFITYFTYDVLGEYVIEVVLIFLLKRNLMILRLILIL